jgi:Virulence activator alpha C-term
LWFRAVPGEEPPPRDELVMKVMIAASVDPDGSVEVIQSHRRQIIESMRRFTRIKADDDASTATLMMCDAELFRLEAAIRWLDAVEARLHRGDRLTVLDTPVSAAPATTNQEVTR